MSEKLTIRIDAVYVADLLGTLFDKVAFLEGEIAAMRHNQTDLCVQWVKALGDPQNPEELNAAMERAGIAHGEPLRPRLTDEQIDQLIALVRAA
jgi:dihydrodipicolinate synthase/N-acetylneuraminate lyase